MCNALIGLYWMAVVVSNLTKSFFVQHLQSERHKAFSKSDEYLVVDGQVSMLQCKFIHIRTRLTR